MSKRGDGSRLVLSIEGDEASLGNQIKAQVDLGDGNLGAPVMLSWAQLNAP